MDIRTTQTSIFLLLILCLFSLSACFRPDNPYPAFEPDSTSQQVEIPLGLYDPSIGDVRYANQVFLDLGSGTYSFAERTTWDLGFATGPDQNSVILNSANYMQLANASGKAFGESWTETELETLTFRFDSAIGSLAYTAIGDWQAKNAPTFILDLGLNIDFSARGYLQLQILSVDETTFTFRTAALDGCLIKEHELSKNPAQNFTFYSLENAHSVSVAPPKTEWDLMFSYYSYRYPDGVPYWLTGALSNRFAVQTAQLHDSIQSWESLSLVDTVSYDFGSEVDIIGFDWKAYLFGPPARFVSYPEQIYLLRDTEGYYYKLRFLDFYNTEGLKGFPQLEYALLTP
ncbi:MAG: HmuY family protein [Bacteroidia bacterium]